MMQMKVPMCTVARGGLKEALKLPRSGGVNRRVTLWNGPLGETLRAGPVLGFDFWGCKDGKEEPDEQKRSMIVLRRYPEYFFKLYGSFIPTKLADVQLRGGIWAGCFPPSQLLSGEHKHKHRAGSLPALRSLARSACVHALTDVAKTSTKKILQTIC